MYIRSCKSNEVRFYSEVTMEIDKSGIPILYIIMFIHTKPMLQNVTDNLSTSVILERKRARGSQGYLECTVLKIFISSFAELELRMTKTDPTHPLNSKGDIYSNMSFNRAIQNQSSPVPFDVSPEETLQVHQIYTSNIFIHATTPHLQWSRQETGLANCLPS